MENFGNWKLFLHTVPPPYRGERGKEYFLPRKSITKCGNDKIKNLAKAGEGCKQALA